MTKTKAKELRGDFIPASTERVSLLNLAFRRTHEWEVYRCAVRVSHDPQSGPIYCGEVAEWLAPLTENKVVVLCDRHYAQRRL